VSLKNTVYVLPDEPRLRKELAGLVREVLERGGDAIVCEAKMIAGITDPSLADRFRAARDAEYAEVAREARALADSLRPAGGRRRGSTRALKHLRLRLEGIVARDPFDSGGRDAAVALVSLAEDRREGIERGPGGAARPPSLPPRGATWVTREGPMVDRIASAWLIRRFIDPAARFRFVAGRHRRPRPDEIRFDMAGAEFTHEGDRCTFETLLERFRIHDAALRAIGEIVHDLDLGDERYGRPEASGLGRTLVGLALGTPDDQERLVRGATILDGLYESFRRGR
jgi:hypothetical protein